jgi:hypothetical protein
MDDSVKWIVATIITVGAAGGGVAAWMGLLKARRQRRREHFWKSLQVHYFESFDIRHVNSTVQGWREFDEEVWSARISNGIFCYINRTDPDAAHYNHIGIGDEDISDRPVAVDVRTENLPGGGPSTGSGLCYRFDRERNFYYAFTLSPTGECRFYKRNDVGYNAISSEKPPSFKSGGYNRLAIIGRGSKLYLFLNDVFIRVIEDDELKSGVCGVIALGIGRHCFDNFTIYRKTSVLPY